MLNSTYVKIDFKQIADNSTQLNSEEITQLLRLLKDFEEFFDGTLGDWATEPANLDIKPGYKPLNSKYYPVPRINKENFRKKIKCLVEIGVRTPVQQSQYSNPLFIIPKKEGMLRFITDYHRLNQQLVRNPHSSPIIGKTMQKL